MAIATRMRARNLTSKIILKLKMRLQTGKTKVSIQSNLHLRLKLPQKMRAATIKKIYQYPVGLVAMHPRPSSNRQIILCMPNKAAMKKMKGMIRAWI
jgi:hypothetical protein